MSGRPLADAVGLWPMNSLGGRIFDFSGNGLHSVSWDDNVAWITGPVIQFSNSIDSSIGLPIGKYGLPGQSGCTIIAGVIPDAVQTDLTGIILSIDRGIIGSTRASLSFRSNGTIMCGGRSANEAYQSLSTIDTLVPGRLSIIAAVMDLPADRIRLFIDGRLSREGAVVFVQDTFANTTTAANPAIGDLSPGDNGFCYEGAIVFVYLYNRIVHASEISKQYREFYCMYPENIMPEFGIVA